MDQPPKKDITHYRFLRRDLNLFVILVSVLPMVMVSGYILYQFKISYHSKTKAHLEELVHKHTQNIDNFLKDKLSTIQALVHNYTFEQMKNESFLKKRLEILYKCYGPVFVDLGVITNKGVQVAYAGPFKLGKAKYKNAAWFQKAMKSDYYKSDVFLGLRGLPHFIIAVTDHHKGKKWILRATIDFVAFNNLVEEIRLGKTGFAFILNSKGEFQTKPLLEIIPHHHPYKEFLSYEEDARKKTYIVERPDDSGQKNIYVAAFLKHGQWLLIYQQRSSDAFSGYTRALHAALIITAVIMLIVVLIGFAASNRLVRIIFRKEKEKQMMNEQIVETGKLASVGELAAGIAHEINNPVAIMVEEAGWIGDLLEEEEFKEGQNLDEFKRALTQINTQGRRCKEITHKLLSFARKTDSRTQKVHLKEMIEELVALSAQRAKYSNVSIKSEIQEDMPAVNMSLSELQQVFLNLINNALDAMEKKGGTIHITGSLENDHVIISIQDTGPGIPGANIKRIFDPFFTTKPVGKGTGLGLAICYGIVKKLGGKIEVRSTMGVGTIFHVKLPLS